MSMEYRNRYGDILTFNKVDDTCIEMKGGTYYRMGFNPKEPDKYNMVDPSGGPYIAQGLDMGCFDSDWEGMKVEYITYNSKSEAYNLYMKEV